MKIEHHERRTDELLDEWWEEAGMVGFIPTSNAYKFDPSADILLVSIRDIGPIDREPLFRDNDQGTARERVLSILNGFRFSNVFPPIEIAQGQRPYRYKLTHGVHRLYCSIAAGFTHVPAVPGFDWDAV